MLSGWGKNEVSSRTGSPFTKHPVSSFPPAIPLVGVGVRCQWFTKPTILALESLVGVQLKNWQDLPASQVFLAGGPGFFCLFPKLLTFGNRPDKQILQPHY